jgi:hypothetical protein
MSPGPVAVAPPTGADGAALRLTRDRLVLESVDSGHHMPRRRRAGDDDEGGRGLHLVASLADRWGFRATDDGKVVWAELDLA